MPGQTEPQKRKHTNEGIALDASWSNKRIALDAVAPTPTLILQPVNHQHSSSTQARLFSVENKKTRISHPQTSNLTRTAVVDDQLIFQKTREDVTMDSWRNEWWTKDKDDMNSGRRPLSLLCEPIARDLESHEPSANKVFLIHHDWHMVTEGRRQQELRWEQERANRIQRHHERHAECMILEIQRNINRQRVKKAAQCARVIDLTHDEPTVRKTLQTVPHKVSRYSLADAWTRTCDANRSFAPYPQSTWKIPTRLATDVPIFEDACKAGSFTHQTIQSEQKLHGIPKPEINCLYSRPRRL
jgi:hypothetical protein